MARPKKSRPTKPPTRPPQGLPDRETLLNFIREQGEPNKAGIANAFGLKGADRRALRQMLQALEAEGALGKRGRRGRFGPKMGKLLEIVGREDEPRAASLIAIHAHGIPMGFSAAAEAEAEAAEPPVLAGREDLRQVPLITIDPPDARDHDDAVFA